MANQKVTERVSLASGAVSPSTDIIPIVDVSAGASGSKKITINDLFTGWGFTAAGANLAKAADKNAQKTLLDIGITFDPLITGLTGGGSTNLDGVPTSGLGKELRFVRVSGKDYIYKGTLHGLPIVEEPPYVIVADDNINYSWDLITLFVNTVEAGYYKINDGVGVATIDMSAGGGGNPYTRINDVVGGGNLRIEYPLPGASTQIITFPASSGEIALTKGVTSMIPASGATLVIGSDIDEFYYIDPSGTIGSLIVQFPDLINCTAGQEVELYSEDAIIALTLTAGSGTTIGAGAPTAFAANQSHRFVFTPLNSRWVYVS